MKVFLFIVISYFNFWLVIIILLDNFERGLSFKDSPFSPENKED